MLVGLGIMVNDISIYCSLYGMVYCSLNGMVYCSLNGMDEKIPLPHRLWLINVRRQKYIRFHKSFSLLGVEAVCC